jgi:1-acyl-sn-glycerol-3-phosphate acyltransferase
MDVLVIASKVPTLFVTSTEMRDTPFLGWITRLGECLYVNRRSHKNINNEIKNIQAWLNKGFNVLIFPEATTSNGFQLRPFKSSLLQIAQNGIVHITAYCLKYEKLNGNKLTEQKMTDVVSWFENASFLPHVFKQLMNKSVSFSLTEVDYFLSNSEPDRKAMVTRLEKNISDEFYKSVSI